MTVDQTALSLPNQEVQDTDDLAKIREFTGKDFTAIESAIKACCNNEGAYEVEDVINYLISHSSAESPAKPSTKVVPVSVASQSEKIPTEETQRELFIGPQNKPGTGSGSGPGVIDLTTENHENEEIQRAIAESLRDSQGILGGQILSREEQEISRVLEQSLLEESKAGTKRKRADIWFVDPLNPHERKRTPHWPVGLKNVGNTCWFSAVIQSLFNVPKFRKLVLDFNPPAELSTGNTTENRNLHFMQELRRLFALMLGSKKKYVDPSRAVEILKEAFTSGPGAADSQQDVSEFQHKLLEWLEDAFRSDQSRPPSPEHGASGSTAEASSSSETVSSTNPMIQLFYGQYLAEGFNEGKSFVNKETFGQFPLQVDGFSDIHESLEGATAQGEIETVSQEITSKSGQELWFTCLPPVLTFELSRFQFNQSLGRPEKIHNQLSFPETIYMDRYMECNKCVTRQKREEVKRLKERLHRLQARLDKFTNYGSGPKRFPLQDVLQYALEFAENRTTTNSASDALSPTTSQTDPVQSPSHPYTDVEMESPKSYVSMVTDSPVGTPTKPDPPPPPLNINSPNLSMEMATKTPTSSPEKTPTDPRSQISIVTESAPLATTGTGDQIGKDLLRTPTHTFPGPGPNELPSPRHVSHQELRTLQMCLRRWRKEVELDVKELQDQIGQLEKTINAMYSEPGLQKCAYRLHAVLVHEGQAASGHYWAYVYSFKYKTWMKFNDITVTSACWEELAREGTGGFHNTSAYCLMYVDPNKITTVAVDGETGQSESLEGDNLPIDLLKYVNVDNDRFEKEIHDWDTEQRKKATKSLSDSEIPGPSTSIKSSQPAGSSSKSTAAPRKIDLATHHAQLAIKRTYQLVAKILESDSFKQHGPEAALQEYCTKEVDRLLTLEETLETSLPAKDHRLHHMLVYLLVNDVKSEDIIKRIILEPFLFMADLERDEGAGKVRQGAIEILNSVRKSARISQGETLYEFWHRQYHLYRTTVSAFIKGHEAFHNELYVDSLPYLTYACDINQSLTSDGGKYRGMDQRILGYYHRQCLLHVNEHLSSLCESHDDITESIDLMKNLVLPCFTVLAASQSSDDQGTVEEIRSRWCKFLGDDDLPKSKLDLLQDFLSRLFDTPAEIKSLCTPSVLKFTSGQELEDHYDKAMELAKDAGYLEAALKSQ